MNSSWIHLIMFGQTDDVIKWLAGDEEENNQLLTDNYNIETVKKRVRRASNATFLDN